MSDQRALIDHKQSVKKADIGKNTSGTNFVFWVPYTPNTISQLPPRLPDPAQNYWGLWPNERDKILMSTVYFESFWAGAVGIEASKFASSGWALSSDKQRIQERFQNVLLNTSVGVMTGWVPFASAGYSSFANTGKWFIEVERYTRNRNSRIKALHHLSPRRCWLTTDPEIPVLYLDLQGSFHDLKRHQVMIFSDMPDPDENTQNSPLSCAVRAYDSILQLSALKWYLYEKMTGRRPLAFHFLQGVSDKTVQEAIENAQASADEVGVTSYMGAVMSAIMGDTQLNLVTVPLAEIPDGVNVEELRTYCHLEYANALGDDPTRLDPRLIGNRQLGAGAQARYLDLKARQGGSIVMLKRNLEHEILKLLRQEKIQFAFEEYDLSDEQARADVAQTRAETRKTQVESGEISTGQAANLAVDQGDIPPEFIPADETEHEILEDSDQPIDRGQEQEQMRVEIASVETTPEITEELEETEKQINPDNEKELEELIQNQLPNAEKLYEELKNAS